MTCGCCCWAGVGDDDDNNAVRRDAERSIGGGDAVGAVAPKGMDGAGCGAVG